MIVTIFLIYGLQLLHGAPVKKVSVEESTIKYWQKNGHEDLLKKINELQNKKQAKNIILFIGDGMGPSTITATRIYKNQRMVNSTSPDINLTFDSLTNVGVVKTHSVDDYVTDSSATATAILTGVKIRSHVVGAGPDTIYNDCSSYNPARDDLTSIATMFFQKEKSVGIVTTTRITHATPSSLYAHSASRNWEYKVPTGCAQDDIALQLFKKAEQFKVILGGGSNYFIPKSMGGRRKDERDLLSEWKSKMKKFKSVLVTNSNDFRSVDPPNTDYLFGLLGPDHLAYDVSRGTQASIAEMTETAIKILQKNENGFFLLVEGGKIDFAHHASKSILAILETLSFDKAIDQALKQISLDDTLIMVTADHSHVFTVGSYAHRENDITLKNQGLSGKELDKKGHTSLLYSNGPGFKSPRENITDDTKFDHNSVYSSGVPLNRESHGGEDIIVHAQGPWSHLVNGLHHQSYLAYVMMFASCSGHYDKASHCSSQKTAKIAFQLIFVKLILYFVIYRYLQ